MSRQRAQSMFSGAYEGDLSPAEQADFEGLLQDDAQVQSDYAAFRRMMRQTEGAFSRHPTPDLLRGVQNRLGNHKPATRGDRLGQLRGAGRMQPLVLAAIAAAFLGLIWALFMAFQTVQTVQTAPPSPTPSDTSQAAPEASPTTASDSPALDSDR